MLVWLGLIMVGALALRGIYVDKTIVSPFSPTATPTRTIFSFEQEGDTYFQIGNLESAIHSYQEATNLKPNDPELWTKLARIQVYSTKSLSTEEDKLQRLQEAQASIEKAVALDPESSKVHAVKAFVLDWLATAELTTKEDRTRLIGQAESEANTAIMRDEQNVQALAYSAEIYADQGIWLRAQQTIAQAMQRAPDDLDVRRINGQVLELLGDYEGAIKEFEAAAKINPNLTFLYIQIGQYYRFLAQQLQVSDVAKSNEYYATALDYFTKAVTINAQLGIKDPIPYLSISKTYTFMGQFFPAVRNICKALQFRPADKVVYAQLGSVYHQSRNYEGAIEAFECAIDGCGPDKSALVQEHCQNATITEGITIEPISLTDSTVVYYYTYGSVRSALSKPTNDYCVSAMAIFKKIRDGYAPGNAIKLTQEEFVMRIVSAGESICTAQPEVQPTNTRVPTPVIPGARLTVQPTP